MKRRFLTDIFYDSAITIRILSIFFCTTIILVTRQPFREERLLFLYFKTTPQQQKIKNNLLILIFQQENPRYNKHRFLPTLHECGNPMSHPQK